MMTTLTLCLIFIVGCGVSVQSIGYDESKSNFYTAGVVEFRPNRFGLSSADTLADHLKAYEEIIRSAAANETDIIVFPEETLNNVFQMTFVPSPVDDVIPCLESTPVYADFLVKLSCIARDVKKYLVINLTEKQNCTAVPHDPRPCATTGLNIFNTNVVFDRAGRVISRYRKVNLFVEAKNTTLEPEYAIFETDFGVRFGHFICFDILFFTPAQELVTKYGVKDFIFTTYFYSELPFLTASQLQQSWAWGNNVNLLAAGGSVPQTGTTGSGIYVGNSGHLVAAMVGWTGERQLYVERVPKTVAAIKARKKQLMSAHNSLTIKTRKTGISLRKDPQIDNYKSKLLNFVHEPSLSLQLCDLGFCCNLKVNVTYFEPPFDASIYQYRFGVFNGRRGYDAQVWSDIKNCAIYTCISEDPHSCGQTFDGKKNISMNIRFESIEVSGNFEKNGQPLIMPTTLDDQLYSLNADAVNWQMKNLSDHFAVNFKLTRPRDNLLTFGIYSQYFERSSGSVVRTAFMLVFCGVLPNLYY